MSLVADSWLHAPTTDAQAFGLKTGIQECRDGSALSTPCLRAAEASLRTERIAEANHCGKHVVTEEDLHSGMGLDAMLARDFPSGAEDERWAEAERRHRAAVQAGLRVAGTTEFVARLASEEDDALSDLSWRVGGYASLHYLRRYAVHVGEGTTAPVEAKDDATEDPALRRWYETEREQIAPGVWEYRGPASSASTGGWLGLFSKKQKSKFFPLHLVMHSDADGYYVPLDFARPIEVGYMGVNGKPTTTTIGSSIRLLAELDVVAAHLRLPEGLDPDGDVFDRVVPDGEAWQRFLIAARVCTVLRALARESVRRHALIEFC